MVAQSHADLSSFMYGFDISLPLINVRAGSDARLSRLLLSH
jgi:hypothetical protein